MILTKPSILNEIKKGRIKITPYQKANIGPASIDLTLDNQFRFPSAKKINLAENTDYKKHTTLVKANKITLKPGDFILAITKETISLPEDIVGILTGRTRFARLGLAVHVTASLVQPGVNNKQVLEIKNVGNSDLTLKSGLKICQIVLERAEGKAKYRGKFQKQAL
jgi:dCTP deaminase